jgi:hypothetical protein
MICTSKNLFKGFKGFNVVQSASRVQKLFKALRAFNVVQDGSILFPARAGFKVVQNIMPFSRQV